MSEGHFCVGQTFFRGVFNNFSKFSKKEFPQYDDHAFHLCTRVFTWFRVRVINKAAKFQKRKEKGQNVKQKKMTQKRILLWPHSNNFVNEFMFILHLSFFASH